MSSSSSSARYSEQAKRDACQYIADNLHAIEHNLTGLHVTLMPAPSLATTAPSSSRFCLQIEASREAAFFYDDPCPVPARHREPSRENRPRVAWRDASVDAEYLTPHRTLIVPHRIVEAEQARRPRLSPFVFLLVGESHGLHIQHYRRWLPPSVIVLFPLASEPVVNGDDVTLRIDTLGVIRSPVTDENWAPYGPESLPLFFGSLAEYTRIYAGPQSARTKYITSSPPSQLSSPPSQAVSPIWRRRLQYTGGDIPLPTADAEAENEAALFSDSLLVAVDVSESISSIRPPSPPSSDDPASGGDGDGNDSSLVGAKRKRTE